MPTFRKKPVEIEAVKCADALQGRMPPWLLVACETGGAAIRPETREVKILTLEGNMIANEGDWIIKGVKGEFYPCKPDIFAATYEPA